MSAIGPSVGVITLFEPDLDEAKEFYLRVFNKEPDFVDDQTANYHFDHLIINLEWESGSADQIGVLPVAPQEAGNRVVISTFVDDVDEACAELKERGVAIISGPENTPWGTRRAIFTDPGGHLWKVVQNSSG